MDTFGGYTDGGVRYMGTIRANGTEREISIAVFDKDGLMFRSQPFWSHLGDVRMHALGRYLPAEGIAEWVRVFGLTLTDGVVTYTDPKGTLAVAAPREERAVTAGMMVKYLSIPWAKARELADAVFTEADEAMDLHKALVPTDGFPDILDRLRRAGIAYAVATSDTRDRVLASFGLVGEEPPELIVVPEMVEHGKPAPDMLLYISEAAGVPAERIAMIGDSYVDVKMAHAAGSIGLGVTPDPEMQRKMEGFATEIIPSLELITVERG